MTSKKFRDADYLEHIASRIARIERATSGVDLAGFLENEFWNDTDRPFVRGLLFVPFILTALVAGIARLRRRPKVSP